MSNERTTLRKFSIRLDKYDHTYLIRYREGYVTEALVQLAAWAEDPQLNFDWHDETCLRRMILRKANGQTGEILD